VLSQEKSAAHAACRLGTLPGPVLSEKNARLLAGFRRKRARPA